MTNPVPSFLIGSSSFFQVTRTCIKIPPLTTDLAALECLEKQDNIVKNLAPSFLIGSSSFLQVTRESITSRMSLKYGQIRSKFAALERLEKSPYAYNGRNVENTLAPTFFIESSSFLQVTRTCINAWMNLNFGEIPTRTTE